MRIAVVSPINSMESEYCKDVRASPFLGGWRLKYWVESVTDYKVDVINSMLKNVYDIDYSRYDVVGISSYYPTRREDLKLGKFIKPRYRLPLVYGGQNPHFQPNFYQETADCIVQGEGEKPLVNYLNGMKIPIFPPDPLSEAEWEEASVNMDYEDIPWRKIWEYNRKHWPKMDDACRFVGISHCTMNCTFCTSSNFLGNVKVMSTRGMVNVINKLEVQNPELVIIQGDDELLNEKARGRFFSIMENGWEPDVPLMVQTNPIRIDEDIAKCFSEINVKKVSMGVESFNSKLLKKWRKATTPQRNEKAINILRDYGIDVFCNVILLEDDEITKRKMKDLDDDGIEWGINRKIIPLPGSDIWGK